MHLFHNDYNEICHSAVLDKMLSRRELQMPGYGEDPACEKAADRIRELCGAKNAAVHFLVGGTQTNLLVAAAALRPHQAVLGAQSAHIFVHETGAVEATGHKVVTLPSADGKLTAEGIRAALEAQRKDENKEHNVQLKLVYISQSTELGTTYKLAELEAISAVCREYGIYLYMDGARLGYALEACDNDMTLQDIARLCDAFYIGGTKVGAMFGEALVILNPAIAEDFRYIIKQRGALLAKGWLLGLQFEALFEDDLYFKVSRHADAMADRLRDTLAELGYDLYLPGTTNQVFAVLPDSVLNKLSEDFTFMLQEKLTDGRSAVRFCTSWATTEESVTALCEAFRNLSE